MRLKASGGKGMGHRDKKKDVASCESWIRGSGFRAKVHGTESKGHRVAGKFFGWWK